MLCIGQIQSTITGCISSTPWGAVETSGILLQTAHRSKNTQVQIEKDSLAGVWAFKKFDRNLNGLEQFNLINDHKPLVPLIYSHNLDDVSLWCQQLLMRFMRLNPVSEY